MRVREMAAAVVGPGKKMTRRGWHISEGGEGRPGGPAGRWAGWPVGRRKGEGRWPTAGPKGRMGWLATGPIGPQVKEKFFSE
jgi:hypothetical protein